MLLVILFFNGFLDNFNKFFEWYLRLTYFNYYFRVNNEVDYKYKYNFLKYVFFSIKFFFFWELVF